MMRNEPQPSSFTYPRVLFAIAALLCLTSLSNAQTGDPDPNSPLPVLLSGSDTTRVLATKSTAKPRTGIPRSSEDRFDPNSRATLYVTNVQLMKGEGSSAFRVYAEDARRRLFRFP